MNARRRGALHRASRGWTIEPAERIARREPMAHQAYRRLRRAILQGRILAGTPLVAADLAKRLGVSRTPVREAILLLRADGLVTVLPSGALVVKDVAEELEEILGVRAALEVYAARLAIERIAPNELSRLEAICRGYEALDAREVEKRSRLNRQFHEGLVAASRNRRLVKVIAEYREYFLVASRLYDPETVRRTAYEHREILEAVKRGDGIVVETLLRTHLEWAWKAIVASRGSGGVARDDAAARPAPTAQGSRGHEAGP